MVTETVFYDEDAPIAARPILSSPWVLALIVISYVSFVKVIGPRYMAKRRPYSLKYPMLLYNLTMVAFNASLILKFTQIYHGYSFLGLGYFWQYACHPLERSTNPLVMAYKNGMLDFYFSKILDLTDTVFLVLRKKDSQLSFLHFFHHLSTLIVVWLSVYIIRDEIGAVMGVLNSSVHVIMYSYYFLAALGPKVRKYLWWKKYLTQIQIVQLVIIISIITRLSTNNCELTADFKYMWGSLILMNLALFLNFYRKSYLNK